MGYLAGLGAIRARLPPELPLKAIRELAASRSAEIEVQVFGRLPLAISARCPHARAYKLHKDSCQYVCGEDPDGLPVATMDHHALRRLRELPGRLAEEGNTVMATDLKTMMDRLPAKRRRKVEARAAELIAEEMTLRDLRKARDLTQARLAEMLDIGQDSVSRLEQRSDLMLSTLRGYVAALGGRLELIAKFPDRPDVALTGLADLPNAEAPAKKRRAIKRSAMGQGISG